MQNAKKGFGLNLVIFSQSNDIWRNLGDAFKKFNILTGVRSGKKVSCIKNIASKMAFLKVISKEKDFKSKKVNKAPNAIHLLNCSHRRF